MPGSLNMTLESPTDVLKHPQFPRSSAYHPDWIVASVGGGAHSLWLTEWLTSELELGAGMKVLDLGCGRAASSIFLAREFGVKVWAADLWFSASENQRRISDAGLGESVFPVHADARELPFATECFDAIVGIDSFPYFATDDFYLANLARFVKPGGIIAFVGAGQMREIEGDLPEHLQDWWTLEPGLWALHSAAWWRRHWQRTGIVDVELSDNMPDGWRRWLDWHRLIAPDNAVEIQAVERDGGQYLGYVRVVGRRRKDVVLADPTVSVPTNYQVTPLLRPD